MEKSEIIKSVRDGSILDLLYQNKLTQMEVIDLVGEILYVSTIRLSGEDRDEFYNQIADGLESQYEDYEEDEITDEDIDNMFEVYKMEENK